MKYPKKVMSLKELRDLGFSRQTLTEYTYIKDFPGFNPGGGKWFVDTDEFEPWRIKVEEARRRKQRRI